VRGALPHIHSPIHFLFEVMPCRVNRPWMHTIIDSPRSTSTCYHDPYLLGLQRMSTVAGFSTAVI
jgi:hypothetical protein